MFDFDELDGAEEPEKQDAPNTEKAPTAPAEAAVASGPKATDKLSMGMWLECIERLQLCEHEDASSSIVGHLPAETTVQVLEIGTGSSGDRVKVRDYVNEREGWLSVASADGSERLRPAAIEAIAAASPTPSSSPVPSSSPAPSPKPRDLQKPEEALSFGAPLAADRPNAKYSAGMWLQCIGPVLTREGEDLESPQLCRLSPDSLAQVLEIGTGPTGKRIRVRARDTGQEGWASVIAQNTAPMFRNAETPEAEVATNSVAKAAEPPRDAVAKVEPQNTAPAKAPAAAPASTSQTPKVWSSILPGDTCACKTTVILRRKEDLQSEMVCRLAVGYEVEILEAGTDSEGRRFKARDKQGRLGWLSALTAEGTYLLEVTQRGSQSLYVGEGQALGGGASVDPRKAALAAAERRQASALSRGVGEKAAKTLQQSGQREAVMKKITELYAKRREDVPIALQSASLEALQKHLETESAPAAAKEEPPARQRPPSKDFASFAPEPRRAPEPTPKAASAAPASSTPASSSGDAWKRQEATTRGLSSDQFEAVLSIESLLGFDFSRALQAFISAGGDQELAANLLLEEGQEGTRSFSGTGFGREAVALIA